MADDSAPLLFDGVCKVVCDRIMGRCLELNSQSVVVAGTMLWREAALVYASDELNDDEIDDLQELEINYEWLQLAASRSVSGNNRKTKKGQNKQNSTTDLLMNYNQHCEAMASYENIASVDTAKNLFQLIALHSLRSTGSNNSLNVQTIFNSSPSSGLNCSQDDLELLDLLGGSKVDACVESIRQFRSANPNAIPAHLGDDVVGRYLAILNNNQIELEEVGGSGLFVRSAILEHSCVPNCSFSSDEGGVLRVTTIKDVNPNERLSIDYGNDFYRCTADRQSALRSTYGFTCTCPKCSTADCFRCFACGLCDTGYFNINEKDKINGESILTKCFNCHKCNNLSYIDICYEKEKEYIDRIIYNKEQTPLTLVHVNRIIEEKIIHERHYIIFWAIDKLAAINTEAARASDGAAATEKYNHALQLTMQGHSLFAKAYPGMHAEHIVYLDKIAQLFVATNNIKLAQEYYRRAYEMSALLNGRDSKTSNDLLQLMTNPPKTLFELQSFY